MVRIARGAERVVCGRRALVAVLVGVALALGSASVAAAKTWYISPTTINETNSSVNACSGGPSCIEPGSTEVIDGSPITGLTASLPASQQPTPTNTNAWQFTAPKLDYGADAYVAYSMPDGDQFATYTQDDIGELNFGVDDDPAAYCVAPWPTTSNEYSCAATFGTPPPNPNGYAWPDSAKFAPFYNFRENSTDAPAGSRMATVTAAGQTCSGEMASGGSTDCMNQGWMQGFSPVDPDNDELLMFINRGSNPVTITHCGSGGCGTPSSCTMTTWGSTCTLAVTPGLPDLQISPGPNAPQGDAWYGVEVAVQGEVGSWVLQDENSSFWSSLLLDVAQSALQNGFGGPPVNPVDNAVGGSRGRPRISGLTLQQIDLRQATTATDARGLPPLPGGLRYAANVHYRINQRLPVTFTIQRQRSGVRRHGACVLSRAARRLGSRTGAVIRGRGCVGWQATPGRYVSAAGLRPGSYGWRFSGRLPGQRMLSPGRYRMTAQVRAPWPTSASLRVPFTISTSKAWSR
jgi:hypothetical protein